MTTQVRATGIDPQLDEQGVLNMLRDEGYPMTPNGVRTAVSLVLLGTFDRQVKRKFFAEMLDLCARIEITVSGVECGFKMAAAMKKIEPDKKPETIYAEMAKLSETWKTQRRELADKFALVCECPTGDDPIS